MSEQTVSVCVRVCVRERVFGCACDAFAECVCENC